MNTGFSERSVPSEAGIDRTHDKDYSFDRPHAGAVDFSKQHQHHRPASQSSNSLPTPSSQPQYIGSSYQNPMYSTPHHIKLSAQQHHPHHHHPSADAQVQRANNNLNVPRSVTTPSWTSGTTSTAYSSSSNLSTAGPTAPSTSSPSGSVLNYWDQGVSGDHELNMTSTMPAHDAYHGFSEMGAHHRHASSAASLPSLSASGVVAHPTSSGYMAASAVHYHPYRPSSLQSMGSGMSSQHVYHSSHQPGSAGGMAYTSSVPAPLSSPGFVYGPSGSSAPLGAGGGSYDGYSQGFPAHSQYVSYLPPALSHDSRFYPLNPFEIKHRRRTTKTQFRVLESTFREIPKPNAALRKQISAQLDMPVRAVQIWFQNRRAKAKAMDKKRQAGAGAGDGKGETSHAGAGRERSTSGVSNQSAYMDQNERRPEMSSYDDAMQSHASHFDDTKTANNRSMDLPPLRIQQVAYGSGQTLPSINLDSRDRRENVAPNLGMASSYMSHSNSQDNANASLALHSGNAEGTTSPSNSTLSAGMPAGSDRSRMPSYQARDDSMLHSTSPRPPSSHDANRFWPPSDQ